MEESCCLLCIDYWHGELMWYRAYYIFTDDVEACVILCIDWWSWVIMWLTDDVEESCVILCINWWSWVIMWVTDDVEESCVTCIDWWRGGIMWLFRHVAVSSRRASVIAAPRRVWVRSHDCCEDTMVRTAKTRNWSMVSQYKLLLYGQNSKFKMSNNITVANPISAKYTVLFNYRNKNIIYWFSRAVSTLSKLYFNSTLVV